MTMTDRQTPEETIEWLLDISDTEFEGVVNNEMRSTEGKRRVTPEIAAGLRDPQVLRRWYTAVMVMHKSVEGQLAAKTADYMALLRRLQSTGAPRNKILTEQSSFETWRAGALRVKNGLEIRLIEAKTRLEQQGDTFIIDSAAYERNMALARVAVLEDAIRRHMNACLSDPRGADEALWVYLPEEE